MNYAGKFDAAISLNGQGSPASAHSHLDSFVAKAHGHVPDGAFVVPDPNLIFNGEFKRTGVDLVLSHDGHDFVVHDYFRGDKRAAIASPDGAHLSGDVVNALTGHVQVAQAGPGAAAAQVIGHVTKLSGSATAIRNGVSVILNNGDNVEKGDVVSTGADSTLGITFIDGTVFGLSSNARMVLNEMVYDPNGSNNSSLLSLVAGTITFVAGETAKHGDMKVDTPVATMGIRGTAVLSQINFVVPAGGGDPQPQASFQVLVEPNGTTGSYILFDKVTLLPIATVNQAGQMIQISGGNVSISNALMSPEVQKLITDVFTLKFTDNNTNTKLTTNFTDTITQTGNIVFIKTETGATATATFTNLNQQGSDGGNHNPSTSTRIPGSPDARSLDANGNVRSAFTLTERPDKTGDTVDSDTVSGRITFIDQNLGDRPTVSVSLAAAPNYVYKSAGQQDVTASLSDLQKQDIAATQIQISVVADPANNNNGSAVWTYTIPDHVFDFLAAGETLTLTYMVRINNNFAVNPESTFIPITITITGTNDKPVITSSVPTITFEGGTSVPGGPLISDVPTSGTLSFDDVDLTDTHTVSVALTSATLPDGTVPPGPLAAFQKAMSVAIAAGADSTGDGTGTINWSLADLPVYLADFIPKGEVLTLVYTVTLTDSQGATSQQTITVTITGTDAPAVVWIATDKPGVPSGGFWKDAANWATGTVPTIDDDVIVITDQLHGLTPSYPVTIDAAAYAKSIAMNDYGGPPPKVINQSTLTISGALNMGADSIFSNTSSGTMSVGGKAEILNTAVFTNAGQLTLAGGGDFAVGTTITNSGMIELSGGTLKTLATVHNAGGTLKADAGTTLIVGAATIDGGTVTILGTLELDGASLIKSGALNNSGKVNVKDSTEFAHETVSNTASGTIKVLANGWLTIDQGSSVTNTGNVTVDASGKLTVNGATISGAGTVTGNGEIDLTGNAALSGGTLKNNATFKVSGTGNALDNETITNASTGTIEVLANGALTIDQGSTVANAGNVTVDASGKLTVNGATISGAGTVTGNGEIDLTGNAALSGGTLKNNATLKVSGTGNALDNETITNASTGTIEVLANGALTIDQGSSVTNTGNVTVDASGKLTVNGATISGAGTVTGNGEIDLTGNAALSGGTLKNNATFKVSGTGNALDNETITNASTGTIEVLANGALTIDQGSTVANAGNVTVDASGKLTVNGATISGAGTVTGNGEIDLTGNAVLTGGVLKNNATFKVSGTGNALDNETITNASTGTIEVLANGALTIDQGSTVANAGNVTVDASGKLTVNGATISGAGTVTGNGEIDLTGNAVLTGGVLKNNAAFKVSGTGNALDNETITNASTGTIEVLANGALTIDQGSTLANAGNVTVDSSGKLTVNGATISGAGTVTGNGEIDLTGNAVLTGGVLKNNATFKVSGIGNALDSETVTNAGTIEVLANGALTIDQGSTVDNSTGNVIVDGNGSLTLHDATISGGAIKGAGTIDVTAASKIDGGATVSIDTITADAALTLDGVTVSGTVITDNASIVLADTVKLEGGARIQGGSITNNGTLEIAGSATLLNDVLTNTAHLIKIDDGKTLTLSGTGIAGGIIDNFSGALGGTIDVTGDSKIDGSATLNQGTVTVESGISLTFGDATVAGTSVTNHGTVKVDGGKTLTMNGAGLTGGTLTVSGTLDSTNTTTVTNASITNNGLIEAIGGLLTLTATTSVAIANAGTLQANGAELDIDHQAVTNTGTLVAINDGTLKVIGTTVTNTGANVSVELGSKLALEDAVIDGGTVTISGTLESTGTSAIDNADITNTGTITVTSGTLTIDPVVMHTITNHSLLQASGGELDISGDLIVNTADIKAINHGTLKLTDVTITNGGGTLTVDGTSSLYLTGVAINGGSLGNSGHLYSVSGANTVSASVTNTGTIEVQAGSLYLSGGLDGAGSVVIDDGATLELAGATAQTMTFAGGTDTLQLDKVAGQSFTGTIAGQSSTGGTFTVTGTADITTASGDALDFTASGGTLANPADIVLTPSGKLTGAANGLVVIQNGVGDISLTATGDIAGLAGNGITLRDSATGSGDITLNNVTGKATGTGASSVGVLVENLNSANTGTISITQLGGATGGAYGIDATTAGNGDITIDAGGAITGSATYGIRSRSYGSGDQTVTTAAGSTTTSGSSGIVVVNRALSLAASSNSTITVNAHGTINSGSSLNQSGNTPAGIQAGYSGATTGTAANTNVNGSVVINNYANITSGGHGIHAYNYGNGDITVNDEAGTSVTGAVAGIKAVALGGGVGDVTVNVGANAKVTGTSGFGIDAYSLNAGNISVVMSDGGVINSGSVGIDAVNEATAIGSGVHSKIFVNAHGTIHSGLTNTPSGNAPAGILAGYTAGGTGQFNSAVHGDVTVQSDATITADAGYGIEAFTWGAGDVTVTTGALSSITAAGTAIGAFDHGGGDVSVTNEGTATGAIGLAAFANGAGDVTILNDGSITSTALAGISVAQNESGATGSTHITNSGTIVAPSAHAAIYIQENATGSALIDNTGSIGSDTVTATNYAIVETGGAITINNTGDINGNISVAHATFNNNAGGTWTVAGSGVFGNASTIVNQGDIALHGASISGSSLSIENDSHIDSWGTASISGTIANTGSIEVHDGRLTLLGSLSGTGSVTIDDGATLELAGATAQTMTFAGGADTLQLDKVAGQSFTGTIAGQSSTGGTFTVTGAADITTSSGDALDFTASGGTLANPADIVLTPSGKLTGAANGLVVIQNGVGDISLTATGDISGLAGNGITLRDSATGSGDITLNNLTGKATGTGGSSVGVLVENLNSANTGTISITQLGGATGGAYGIDATTAGNGDITIDAGGAITGSATYGIRSRSYGSGDQTVTTAAGSTITSGSSGIVGVNRALSLAASSNSTITVNAHGTINSGSTPNLGGNLPAGIEAGYTGATTGTSANTNVNGAVVVNNYANITAAAGYGINAYNYGNGDVTVNSFAGTTISVDGLHSVGINAVALSGGAGNIAVTLGQNVTISGAESYGIRAHSVDKGNISVTLAKGDSITSGSSGIVAVNYATAIAASLASTISVDAHGTIHSGSTLNNDETTPGAIIAGYKPGGNAVFSNAVHGDVIVTSDATLTADAGYGIEAFTWGAGDVTVTTGALSSITAAGTAIGAFDHGGGDVSVTNEGTATGAIGLAAFANGAGDVTILNDGSITSTALAGISVAQNESGATGSTHITNSGTIVAPSAHAAIYIQENATGSALIDNTGSIGSDTVTATNYAIVETGGAITINNTGDINGNISVAHATFNNNAGGTWTVAGSGVFGNASTIVNHGDIALHGASISGSSLSIENDSHIDSWGTASISGTITNTGSIEVHDGDLTLFGSLSGTGSVTVDAGALLKLEGTVSQTIALAGDGAALQIDTASFGGSISDLSNHDTIDLSGIKFGLGSSAVYVANADPATGGVLTVTGDDGQSISLKLTGADYSNAHFAGSDDGTGHTLITISPADDAPAFTTAGATLTASVVEQASTTGDFVTLDPTPAAIGAIDFTDADLTDRPTATITQAVTWLGADHSTDLTASLTSDEIAALQSAFATQLTGKNNGTVSWSYSIADGALDFLGQGETAKVVSTITLDDHQGHSTTADVTVTITGANDAPTLAPVTAGLVDTAATDQFPDITGTLAGTDADHGETATLTYAVLDGTNPVKTLAGHYGVLTVNADGSYDYVPDAAAINALPAGAFSDTFTVQTADVHGATGTAVFTLNVTGANDAPTLGNATLTAITEDASDPAGTTVANLFGAGFHDVDSGSSLKAVAITADHADATQGVWQYEVAGSNQWIDISGVSDGNALVLATDTLIRFVPAANYSGTPGGLDVHALDDTYAGASTGSSAVSIDLATVGSSASATAATLSTEVTPVADPPVFKSMVVNYLADSLTADSIDTTHWKVELPTVTSTVNDPSVTPTTDGVVLHDRGYLETVPGFTPTATNPLHISLSFKLDGTTGSFVEVADGVDGTINSLYGEPANGISYVFGFGNGFIVANNATGQSSNLSASLAANTLYDAVITDDGTHQTVVIVNDATGELVGSYSSNYTNDLAGSLVAITNREANDGDHSATVSHVTISNAFEGTHGTPIALTGLVGVTDTDGSEQLSLNLSGFPDGTTFSVGQAGQGADAGHWLISASDIASLHGAALTMTTPDDYAGDFSLHVGGTVVDSATGLTGPLSDTKTFSNDVAVKVDGAPVIDVDQISVIPSREGGPVLIHGLTVSDADASAGETFTLATNADTGTNVDPASLSGTLASVNNALSELAYSEPSQGNAATDKVAVTVTDGHGASDTVNLIFNLSEQGPVTLTGTSGKDVFFGSGHQDQFVFAANSNHDVIMNFTPGQDQIDLTAVVPTDIDAAWIAQHVAASPANSADSLITIDATDTILLKGIVASNLHASDFIVHS